jgi:hypothetical protein
MTRDGTVTSIGSTSERRYHLKPQIQLSFVVRLVRWPIRNERIQGYE